MTPSTPATCKFCGTVALPNDEQNCSSLDEAYRQTPTRPYGCPWFDKDARKANPAPNPSTPASTDAGSLADEIEKCGGLYCCTAKQGESGYQLGIRKTATVIAALRNSAPQETRGDEPVAWRYRYKAGNYSVWMDAPIPQDFSPELKFEVAYAAPQQSPRLGLSDFADAEIANEHHARLMARLGDQRVGVGFPTGESAMVSSTLRREVGS